MRPSNYHTYTEEELQYIKDHCYDSPKDVATALGCPYGTVLEYMCRFRHGTFERHPFHPQNYYAMYLRKTDELVCSGSARECAEQLGISQMAFRSRVHKTLSGKIKKWDVYVEPYNEETDD